MLQPMSLSEKQVKHGHKMYSPRHGLGHIQYYKLLLRNTYDIP